MVLIFLFSLFTSQALAQNKTITIAVIDTGFGMTESSHHTKYLCKYGHRDFTKEGSYLKDVDTVDPVPKDSMGHGTNIVGIIAREGGKSGLKFCVIVLKYFSEDPKSPTLTIDNSIAAIKYARKIHADYINYSGGGKGQDEREQKAIKQYLDDGGTFIAAAGNESSDLAKVPYYPAMSDDRIVVVGNLGKNLVRVPSSNYGKRVNRWEYGENVEAFGVTLTGTSQATAVATGKIIAEKNKDMIKRRKELK